MSVRNCTSIVDGSSCRLPATARPSSFEWRSPILAKRRFIHYSYVSRAPMSYVTLAKTVFDIEIDGLRQTRACLNDRFSEAVNSIVKCLSHRGKVVVTGIGKSGKIGHKIAATLTSTGTTSVVLDSVDALHGDLGVINDGDCILALSY